jgi:hypothetical protein
MAHSATCEVCSTIGRSRWIPGNHVPCSYRINHEDEFVTLHLEGETDLVEVYELCQRLLKDADYRSDWPQLVDLRALTLSLQAGAMGPFWRYVTTSYRPQVSAPIAVILDGSMDSDFCAGVFRFVCSLPDAEVFDDYALAIKWLLRQAAVVSAPSPQPQNSNRNRTDEHPEQIRA